MATSRQTTAAKIVALRDTVLKAGEIALARFRNVQPQLKKGGEIVTQADKEIEALLVERLRRECPGYGIIGEEMGVSAMGEQGVWKGFDVELLEGDCDWPTVMATLREIGYTGWGAAEIPGGARDRLTKISQLMDRINES